MKRVTNKIQQLKPWEQDPELKQQVQKLVLARVMVLPENMRLTVGSVDFTRKELVKHVQQDDDVGRQITTMQVEFLQDLASGAIYQDEQNYSGHEA